MAPLGEGQSRAVTSEWVDALSGDHVSSRRETLAKLSLAESPKWRHLVREIVSSNRGRLSVLVCCDLFAVAAAINAGYFASPSYDFQIHGYIGLQPEILPMAFAFVLWALSCGLYEKPSGEGNVSLFLRSTVAAFLAWGTVILSQYFVTFAATGRWVVMLSGVVLIGIASSGRLILRRIQKRMPINVIVFGEEQVAQAIRREGKRRPHQPLLVGAVASIDCDTTLSFPIEIPANFRIGDQDRIDWIVVQGTCDGTTLQELLPFFRNGTRIGDVGMFFEIFFQKVPVEIIDTNWLIQANVSLVTIGSRVLKRGMDILAALIGLVLTSLLWPAIALLIKLSSNGPVIYRQQRVGRHGNMFNILKFRTMTVEAESSGKAVWASRTDSRVTPLGRLLRKTRLDELPQFINVLLGHMSLVGPRPERPEFVRVLSEKVPHYQLRHLVRPGITGWAQISYRYAASLEDSVEKLRYDLYYVKYGGFMLDLQIMIRTIGALMRGSR